ncbi:uncharacterized protein LOC107829106 isoform X2 [Nicotiana tabacum]|uniref:Random slug protein 5-like isoform X2 n=2 Tax=Nicotiana tabacum TaxID=4097 RepID=A0A1S4DFB7_TOBAC|nr:PREDICTED: random slug protein 5-like isoform X2 [Nicotiana tabacum]
MFRRKLCPTSQANDSASRDAKISQLRAALGPLCGRSLQFCTDACLRRYLEARNWKLDKAKKMLEDTLKWRSTYNPEEIRWVVKYLIDAKTFAKIKFVYPNNKESTELMKIFFDAENLPREFGEKATLNYDHEEFSRLMAKKMLKLLNFGALTICHPIQMAMDAPKQQK